jgi:tRNA1(Val) A37 N6-methylase TrmN6
LIAKFGKENLKMLDPCAGYSSRLVGFLGQGYSGSYCGIEPCTKTFEGLRNTFEVLKGMDMYKHEANIINGCAEDAIDNLEKNYFDLIFTSPPYFDLEKYSDEKTQSYIKYPTYDLWKNCFLSELIHKCYNVLKPGGVFLLNIGNVRQHRTIEDTENIAKKVFRIHDVFTMHSPSMWKDKISEPIFVLRKD